MQNDPNSQASSFSWFPVSPNTLKLAIIRKANLIFQLISLSNATLLSIVFFACGVHKLNYIKNYLFRDDINMMSMKIIRFSRPPNPLVHLNPKFFHPLYLGCPISNYPPPPFQMITNQLKENII